MKFKNIYERYALQINNLLYPGGPLSRTVIFVGDQQYNEAGESDIEKYVNGELIPWAFMEGVYFHGMIHGNFVVERTYKEPKEVVEGTEEDYDLNTGVLNYVFAVMAAAVKYSKNPSQKITVISYWGEADVATCWEYDSEEEFYEDIKESLEELEEYDEDDEDKEGK